MKKQEFKPYFTYQVITDPNDKNDYIACTFCLNEAIDILEKTLCEYPNACICRMKYFSLFDLPILYDIIKLERT